MNSKKLAAAVRELKSTIDDITDCPNATISDFDNELNDARGLLSVLANIIDGMPIDHAKRFFAAGYPNTAAEWETVMCEEHRTCPDLHDQHQVAGGGCLLCEVQKLQRQLKYEQGTNDFDAKRLRRLAVISGCSVPESDETLLGCAGTVIGAITRQVEKFFQGDKEASAGKWIIHHVGPDDIVDQPDELTALREANKINKELARMVGDDPSDNWPHCWAVVKDMSAESV